MDRTVTTWAPPEGFMASEAIRHYYGSGRSEAERSSPRGYAYFSVGVSREANLVDALVLGSFASAERSTDRTNLLRGLLIKVVTSQFHLKNQSPEQVLITTTRRRIPDYGFLEQDGVENDTFTYVHQPKSCGDVSSPLKTVTRRIPQYHLEPTEE